MTFSNLVTCFLLFQLIYCILFVFQIECETLRAENYNITDTLKATWEEVSTLNLKLDAKE